MADAMSFEKRATRGELEHFNSGQPAASATIQCLTGIGTGSRSERKAALIQRFTDLSKTLAEDLEISLEDVSVSAQTTTGKIPIDRYDKLKQQLAKRGFQVNLRGLVDATLVAESTALIL